MKKRRKRINANSRYNTAEAAELLGTLPGTMRQWRLRGVGPWYEQDGERSPVFYSGADLIEYKKHDSARCVAE